VTQAGQQLPDMFEALDVVKAARLDGCLGLSDKGDPGMGRLGALPRRQG
jgi:hypothetical protein